MKQVGRNIIHDDLPRPAVKLSLLSKVIKKYYQFRMKLIDKRKEKYAAFGIGYSLELFNACVYMKQAYLHKVEALYLKDEVRMLKRAHRKEREK